MERIDSSTTTLLNNPRIISSIVSKSIGDFNCLYQVDETVISCQLSISGFILNSCSLKGGYWNIAPLVDRFHWAPLVEVDSLVALSVFDIYLVSCMSTWIKSQTRIQPVYLTLGSWWHCVGKAQHVLTVFIGSLQSMAIFIEIGYSSSRMPESKVVTKSGCFWDCADGSSSWVNDRSRPKPQQYDLL